MKELNNFVLGKAPVALVKRHLYKRFTLTIQRGRWRLNSSRPLNRKLFLKSLIEIKKKFFLKKGLFNEASNPWKLYLSKISPNK